MNTAHQLDAFAAPREGQRPAPTRGMVRTTDPETSKAAAKVARDHADRVLELVRLCFDTHATLTGKEAQRIVCARHPQIEGNTVRCRFADLTNKHFETVPTGEVRDRCQVYRRATPDETARMRAEAGL